MWAIDTGEKVETFDLGTSAVTSLEFSPNGQNAVTIDESGAAIVWEVDGWRRVCNLPGPPKPMAAKAGGEGEIEPGSKRVPTATSRHRSPKYPYTSNNPTEAVCDEPNEGLPENNEVDGAENEVPRASASAASFAPDGSYVAVAFENLEVRTFDVTKWEVIRSVSLPARYREEEHAAVVQVLTISNDALHLAMLLSDNSILGWDVSVEPAVPRSLALQVGRRSEYESTLRFSNDNRSVICSSPESSAYWDYSAPVRGFETFDGMGPLCEIASTPLFAQAGAAGGALLLEVGSTDRVAELVSEAPLPSRLYGFLPDNSLVAAEVADPFLVFEGIFSSSRRVSSLRPPLFRDSQVVSLSLPPKSEIYAVGVATSGKYLVASSIDPKFATTTQFYRLPNFEPLQHAQDHPASRPIAAARFHVDGRSLLIAQANGTLVRWTSEDPEVLRQSASQELFEALGSPFIASQFAAFASVADISRDGTKIAAAMGLAGLELSAPLRLWVPGAAERPVVKLDTCQFNSDGRVLTEDGKRLIAWRTRVVSLLDANSGESLYEFTGHQEDVVAAVESADGNWLAASAGDGTIRVWSTANGALRNELRAPRANAYFKSRQRLAVEKRNGENVEPAPDESTEPSARRQTLNRAARGEPTDVGSRSIVVRPARRRSTLTASSPDRQMRPRRWVTISQSTHSSAASKEESDDAQQSRSEGLNADSGPGVPPNAKGEFDEIPGSEQSFDDHSAPSSLAISARGGLLATFEASFTRAEPSMTATAEVDSVEAWEPDHRNDGGTIYIWDLRRDRQLCATQIAARPYSLCFSPDGRWLAVTYPKKILGTVELRKVATGEVAMTLVGHTGAVTSIDFSPDGKMLLSGGLDGTARLWDVATGKLLATLVNFNDGSWAVIDPIGRFDASNDGDVAGLHWIVGTEVIELEQIGERYYEPSLLAKVMGWSDEALTPVEAFTTPKLFPTIAAQPPTAGQPFIRLRLTDRGGGIGRVVVNINGKELSSEARRPTDRITKMGRELSVPLPSDHPLLLPRQENEIEVLAYNSENFLRNGRGLTLSYRPPALPEQEPEQLWVLSIGVSDYNGKDMDLRFAAKDARDFATAVEVAGARLFGSERVHVRVLASDAKTDLGAESAATPAARPSLANLRAALADLRRAKSGDLLVVYLAGHGITFQRDFYFLGCDAKSTGLSDPEMLRYVALSSYELTELIKKIPALKQVVVLDTCAAGQYLDELMKRREEPSKTDRVKALVRLRDRTGMYVLAGCAADAVSYEATRFGQGVLTYSLLLGMRGAALRDDSLVDVVKLFNFAVDQVPELARDIGGIQKPKFAPPAGGRSFDFGQVTAAEQSRIPLAVARPLVLRTSFVDAERFDDHLGFGQRVDELLRNQPEATQRGAAPIFVDARSFSQAYRVAGQYRLAGDQLELTVNVFLDQEHRGRFQISGARDDLPALATKSVSEIMRIVGSAAE
jgi:WD40 repeat protein